jgi:hypothetical protein
MTLLTRNICCSKIQQNTNKGDNKKHENYKETKICWILVDPETGETYPMQMNVMEDRDFNFHKVWLQHLVNSLDSISNQKLRLAFWIIDHLDRENQLIMTQRAIADATNMSTKTVNTTLKALCEAPEGSPAFLQRINSGAYRVNPEVIFKGSHSNRMGICYEYKETDTKQQKED